MSANQNETCATTPEGSEPVRLLRELLRVQAHGRWIGRATAVAALMAVLAVLAVVLQTARHNFSDENVRVSVRAETELLWPNVAAEGRALLAELGPVYRREAQRVLQEHAPEARRLLEEELGGVGQLAAEHARTRLESVIDGVADEGHHALAEAFPEVDDDVLTAAVDRLSERMHARTERFVRRLTGSGRASVERFASALQELPGRPEANDEELQREFLHLWLMLLDLELTGDPSGGATTAELSHPVPSHG